MGCLLTNILLLVFSVSCSFTYLIIAIRLKLRCRPFPLPEVPLADVLLLDVPLAEVLQPLDPEPMDPEVAEPVPEHESSSGIMSNTPLDKELVSLLFPSPCEFSCKNKNIKEILFKRSLTS